MSRESCIAHRPKQALAIVRQDYYELMDRDACAAALLNIFEYWANAALTADVTVERPWVGARPIREFEQMLLGIATDKQIRKRLALLEARGFIQTKAPAKRGTAKSYRVCVPEIQQALFGQMTNDETSYRSNDQPVFGQMTCVPLVKQPTLLRSNDRALKNKSKEFKKESLKEARLVLSNSDRDAVERAEVERAEMRSPIQIGVVRYTQPPDTIDLADLWATNPGMAKAQMRFVAPGHKRSEMVAHGFGQWWVGPGLNDFDEFLIKACQQRKRKLQQPDSASDAKTFINNLLKAEDWGNFLLRCEEAIALRERATVLPKTRTIAPIAKSLSPFERSPAERRESALGLARFKVAQGQIQQALTISKQFGLSSAEIGIANRETTITLTQSAA